MSLIQIISGLSAIEPVFLTQRNTAANQLLKARGYTVFVWPSNKLRGIAGLFSRVRFNIRVWLLLRKLTFKAIHINDIDALTHAIPGIRFHSKTQRVVFNIRGVRERSEPYKDHWKLVNETDEIVVLSEEMKSELMARLPLRDRHYWNRHFHVFYSIVTQLPAATSKHDDSNIGRPFRAGDGKKHLLYVAAFSKLKAQLPFIEHALPALHRKGYIVHFVGDFEPLTNPYAQSCAAAVDRLRLQNACVFHGYREEVADFYRRCDVTVVGSLREGLARCMIESLAFGTPVVSFDVCSAREILEAYSCGYVCTQGNYAQLVDKIESLCENTDLLEEFGARGKQVAEILFGKDTIVKQYEDLYLK